LGDKVLRVFWCGGVKYTLENGQQGF